MRLHLTRRVRTLALSLLALVLLYAAVGFWVVPRVVRAQILEFSRDHWQREPVLGEVAFNPFTLALSVDGFAFRDSGGEALLSFDRLRVNLDLSGLWRRGLSFHAIELDRPSGQVLVRPDGTLNLTELSAPFVTPAAATPEPEEPRRLFIDRFQIRDGQVQLEDRARAAPFKARLTPVNFMLSDFSTVAGSDNHYELQATSSEGERLRWSGGFTLAPLGSRGRFELGAVRARTLWSYLQESLGFEVADGLVDLEGGYEFAATHPEVTVRVNLDAVEVAHLKLRARGGQTDLVSLERLAVADTRLDLGARTLDVGRLTLGDGTVAMRRAADGSIDLLSLAASPTAEVSSAASTAASTAAASPVEAPPATEAGARPWTVNAPELTLENLRIEVIDEFVKPSATFALTPVNLHVRGFSTTPGRPLDFDADLALLSGGKLAVRGRGELTARRFAGKFSLEGLDLAAVQPYVGTYTQMTLLSGVLSTELQAEYSPDAWSVRGDVDCANLRTVDDALREDFVKWKRLSLGGIEYRAEPGQSGSLGIASIDAKSPYLRLIIAPDQTTNVGKVLTRPSSAPGPVQTVRGVTATSGTGKPLSIGIGKVRIDDGSANFADFWIKPNYAVSLQQLGGTITGLSSRKDSRARVSLAGRIDRYAPAQIEGELNLLSASLFTDLRVKFDGVELTSVTPYSGRFAGYRIEKGKLSIDVRYRVEDRKLDAQQRFIIDQLELGERVESPDAVKLPLRLAVALLKDRNGVIDLGLPVTGSLDDPKFRIGPIVWKAFVNLLAGIATSPFKLIGGMFGGGEEVNLIDFAPGEATLDTAATEKLTALAKALHERPQLALDVPAMYAPDADYAVLAARGLENRLAALAPTRPGDAGTMDEARRFESLVALHRREMPNVALPASALALQATRPREREAAALLAANAELAAVLRSPADALQDELQALAQRRARAIQDALLASGEVEPARVFMLAPAASPAVAGKARVALSLK